jgi:hypothetical protein
MASSLLLNKDPTEGLWSVTFDAKQKRPPCADRFCIYYLTAAADALDDGAAVAMGSHDDCTATAAIVRIPVTAALPIAVTVPANADADAITVTAFATAHTLTPPTAFAGLGRSTITLGRGGLGLAAS